MFELDVRKIDFTLFCTRTCGDCTLTRFVRIVRVYEIMMLGRVLSNMFEYLCAFIHRGIKHSTLGACTRIYELRSFRRVTAIEWDNQAGRPFFDVFTIETFKLDKIARVILYYIVLLNLACVLTFVLKIRNKCICVYVVHVLQSNTPTHPSTLNNCDYHID